MAATRKQKDTSRLFGSADSADGAVAVTPGASELTYYTRAVYIGGAGNLECEMLNASDAWASITFIGLPAGTVLPIQTRKITAGSTCTSIIALW